MSGGAKIARQVIQNPECSADIEENLLVAAAAIVAIEQIPGSPINNDNCTNSAQAIADLVSKNADNPAISAVLSLLSDESGAQHYLNCASSPGP